MKKLGLFFFLLGFYGVSHAQMTKHDVEEIFTSININKYPKFYITFSNEVGSKKKMENENLAPYEALDPKTAKFEYKENYLHLNGKNYDIYIPYNQIKYIHK